MFGKLNILPNVMCMNSIILSKISIILSKMSIILSKISNCVVHLKTEGYGPTLTSSSK